MTVSFLIQKSLLSLYFLALFFIENAYSFLNKKTNFSRYIKNIQFFLINSFFNIILFIQLLKWGDSYKFFALENTITIVIIQIVFLDVLLYWWHRFNHEIPILWRFHQIHHFDETLDTSSALRFHFGELFLAAILRTLLLLSGLVSIYAIIIFDILVFIISVFHHSKISLPCKLERALSILIVTPSIHWVHHHEKEENTNSNYATIFSLWDILFSSRSQLKRQINMRIGVQGQKDLPLLGLIRKPFSLSNK